MGYMVHHAIIVTSWDEKLLSVAHEKAKTIFGVMVTEILPPSINKYRSFLIGPDGSKEGWEESEAGDVRRDQFIAYLESLAHEDGSHSLDYAEVQYGDDEGNNIVLRTEEDCRKSAEQGGEAGAP